MEQVAKLKMAWNSVPGLEIICGNSLHQMFIPLTKSQFPPPPPPPPLNNKNIIFMCSHCSYTIFVLISYSLDPQVMLVLILIDVRYSQKTVFSFEKGSNCQNHSSSGSHHLVKNPPPSKIFDSLHHLPLFGKPWFVEG